MLTIRDLKIYYKEYCAFHLDGEMQVEEGDRIGVIGTNGAGKTTFVKACLGLVPYSGEIESEIARQDMAAHMQENAYTDTMSVASIMKAILARNPEKDEKLKSIIHFFEFESSLKKKYKQLSGGQKQRFTLILILMQDSKITFFDEVTSGLDFETRQSLMRKIIEWYKNQKTILFFVTHYYEELEQMANKLMIVDKGRVIAFDTKANLFDKYCGYSILTFSKNDEPENFLPEYTRLIAPAQMTAISCNNDKEELAAVKLLSKERIDFKRSSSEIEILSLNVIAQRKILSE